MSMTKQDGAPVGDALREKEEGRPEEVRKAAPPDKIDAFIDAVLDACEIDGLPAARSEAQAAAMSDVQPYLPKYRRDGLRKILQTMLALEFANGVDAGDCGCEHEAEPVADMNDLD